MCHRLRLSFFVLLFVTSACGGAIEGPASGFDSGQAPSDAPRTPPSWPPTPAPTPAPGPPPHTTPRETPCTDGGNACDAGEAYYSNGTECRDASAVCRPTREECPLLSFCGKANPYTCPSTPTCDDGDAEVAECPVGGLCYEVERCGETIACQRLTGAPVPCAIGDTEVDSEVLCKSKPGCYSAGPAHKGDTWYSIWCVPQ